MPLFGMALAVRKDPLGTLRRMAREYGDVVGFSAMGMPRVLISRPEYILQLLVLEHAKLHKSALTKLVVGPLLGQGLLSARGSSGDGSDAWLSRRSSVRAPMSTLR